MAHYYPVFDTKMGKIRRIKTDEHIKKCVTHSERLYELMLKRIAVKAHSGPGELYYNSRLEKIEEEIQHYRDCGFIG